MTTNLNPLFIQDTLPTTSQAAIREFNDRYLAVLGASMPTGWADTLGELIPTDRPMVTFPVSMMQTFYQATEGGQRFKKLREKSFDVKTSEFDDGYEARLEDLFLQVFAYRNWQRAPERLVRAEEQFRHVQVANLLSNGTSGTCVDGTAFFSSSHPINMTDPSILRQTDSSATWANYVSTATNVLGSTASGNAGPFLIDNLQAQVTAMQTSVPDENGYLIGANPDTILVPADYAEPLTIGLANSRMIQFGPAVPASSGVAAAALDNPYQGRFKVVPIKEFTLASGSTADWYLVDSKMLAAGIAPWVVVRQTMPQQLALRIYDEASDYFKDTGNIKMSSHIWYGSSLALPHAIRRIKGPTR